ncbi:MAG: leucyl aminopeptidase [Proteobacteria bacterium]|jgi:leucyl aminopeptidase|nr:leucyl aminopeptidase [Pseudomonadota bacterium]
MQFQEFYTKAIKYLPKVQKTLNSSVVTLIVLENISYKEDLKTYFPQNSDAIVKYLASIPSFEGKFGQSAHVLVNEKHYIVYLIKKGLNEKSVADHQETGATICGILNSHKITSTNLMMPTLNKNTQTQVLYGTLLKNYRFNDFFSKKIDGKEPTLAEINIDGIAEEVLEEVTHLAKNVLLARHLVNYPSTDLNPISYSQMIIQAFEENVTVKVLDIKEMEELGMGMLLAVGRASKNASKMVIMEYKGKSAKTDFDLAIVGKGVCFDSGGLSIKPAGSMEDMKIDMGGSAVAFTSLRAIAKMKLKVNVVALVGLVENMVDNTSYRPGDVVKSMSGQTVEVLNTDAEGRLVLGDVLYYAQKYYKPQYMVNYATLTGAVTVALGDLYAAYMSTNDDISQKLEVASKATGDAIWRLPLGEKYDKMIDSTVADMKNIGSGRGAGTITAGQFLARFINCEDGMNTKWAHVDIAGVAYDGKGGADPRSSKGATGHSVYLTYKLAQLLQQS